MRTISKEGVYDRRCITSAKVIDKCDGCGKENVNGLNTDNSDEEYTDATVCFDCIERLRKELINEQEEVKNLF